MSSKVSNAISAAAGVFAVQGVSLVTAAVLGRLLSPDDFGLVALLLLVNGFLSLLANAGISAVVIQFRDFDEKDIRALLGFGIVVGLTLAGLGFAFAKHIAMLFNAPDLDLVIRLGILVVALMPIEQLINGVLMRDERFLARAVVLFSSSLVAGVIAILMAIEGYGYWALVVQMIIRPSVGILIGLPVAGVSPLPLWDLSIYKKIIRYAVDLVSYRFLSYGAKSYDNFALGRWIGVTELGYYSRAYSLYIFTTNLVQAAVGPVLHVSFVKSATDLNRFKCDVARSLKVMLSLYIPIMGVSAIFAEDLIQVVWGGQWTKSVLPFACLTIAGASLPTQTVAGEAMKAINLTRKLVMFGMVRFAVYALAVTLGVAYGIVGVAISVAVASFLNMLILSYYILKKRIGLALFDLCSLYLPAIKLLVLILALSLLLKYVVLKDYGSLILLISAVPIMTAFYVFMSWALRDAVYGVICNSVSTLWGIVAKKREIM